MSGNGRPVADSRLGGEGSILDLAGVWKSFGATAALEGLDLAVPRRQTTVLIGPSGCGKSTILRLMIGLIRPDRGTVRFDGQDLRDDSVLPLRRRMGYVIQDGGLFPHLTGRANVSLMARHLGWPSGRIDERLAELAHLVRLPIDALDRYPVQLSGGQKQRVSLMRALMLDPDVLLLDEPLGSLDPMIRSELQADLRRVFATLDKSVVLVTHDMNEAGFFGQTIVVLRAGRIVQAGTLQELTLCPADPFVQRFISAQRPRLGRTA